MKAPKNNNEGFAANVWVCVYNDDIVQRPKIRIKISMNVNAWFYYSIVLDFLFFLLVFFKHF